MYQQAWTIPVEMDPHTTISMWSPDVLNTSHLRLASHESPNHVCNELFRYDYEMDNSHNYTPFQCGSFCVNGQVEKDCAPATDLFAGS